MISPVAGSMRETESLKVFATQTAPRPTTIPAGPPGTSIVWTTEFVAGLIRLTVELPPLVTQTEPAPTAIADGSAPTGTVSTTALLSGSIWTIVPRSGNVTQTLPAPAATAPGLDPSGTEPTSLPLSRSMSPRASPAICPASPVRRNAIVAGTPTATARVASASSTAASGWRRT